MEIVLTKTGIAGDLANVIKGVVFSYLYTSCFLILFMHIKEHFEVSG
jgi:hypothetical protein